MDSEVDEDVVDDSSTHASASSMAIRPTDTTSNSGAERGRLNPNAAARAAGVRHDT